MSYTNAFGAGPDATREYVTRLQNLLGDREPQSVLCETPEALRALVRDVDPRRLEAPEKPGKWSVLQVLQHLADSEFAFGFRIRMAIGQDGARLAGFDQDGWMARLRYDGVSAQLLLAAFDAMRSFNILLYRSLSDELLARTATHEERGVESVAHMLRMNAAHDLVHRNQIERILQTLPK